MTEEELKKATSAICEHYEKKELIESKELERRITKKTGICGTCKNQKICLGNLYGAMGL